MTFDFDTVIDRVPTGSMKWSFAKRFLPANQSSANPLPLWVADMDFRSPQPIIDAIKAAADIGIFGYPGPKDGYYETICNWQKKRFNWDAKPEWIIQIPGVVTALNIIIQAFSSPGDSILIQPPVYIHFHEDALANGRRIAPAPLVLEGNRYRFDAKIFEEAIKPNTKIFILCNPHNPTGNVWTADELRQMGDICERHNILVVSDEIHQDLVFNKNVKHTAYASLGEKYANNCIVCTAPSKTFNLAGFQISNIFIPNQGIREEMARQVARNGISFANYLGMVACEAAYTHGEPWLEAVLKYIKGNQEYLASEINKSLPMLKVIETDALYLAWLDCRELGMEAPELADFMLTKAKVWFDDGRKFAQQGHGFMRVNLGCSRATLVEAVERLKTAINQYL